jgi:N-methylhydantoinase B
MPISASLEEEGLILPPTHLYRGGVLQEAVMGQILSAMQNPRDSRGDFAAQASANHAGVARLEQLIGLFGTEAYRSGLTALNDYGERLARASLSAIPDGVYRFRDLMDDDGQGGVDIPIEVTITARAGDVEVDFAGTAPQVAGNINCPLSVAAAGVYYVFRCLMPEQTPACAGSFRPIRLKAPEGCLLNARRPAAVAAGNVETSTRVVDVVMGALARALPERIPAASHGSMNNLAMGAAGRGGGWSYYETIGGGMGAGALGGGLDAVQTHMTNTLNTPVESLEMHYPLRIDRYAIRRGSGGEGRRLGGDGIVRQYTFLGPTTVTLLTERRRHAPWGVAGGGDGEPGRNLFCGREVAAKTSLRAEAGDSLVVETPGGGGWGKDEEPA